MVEYSGSGRLKTIKREKKNYNESQRAWSGHKVYTLQLASATIYCSKLLPARSHDLMARHNHLRLTKAYIMCCVHYIIYYNGILVVRLLI